MKKNLIIGLSIVLILLVSVGIYYTYDTLRAGHPKAAQSPQPKPMQVVVSTAKHEIWHPFISSVGQLHAVQGIDVIPPVAGIISAIHFQSGQHLQAGALMVELDHAVESADLESAQAQAWSAKLDFERESKLYETDQSITQQELDTTEATYQQLKAQAKKAQATLNLKIIRAPFSGQAGIKQVTLGQFVSPSLPTVMTTLSTLGLIRVDYSVPEQHAHTLEVGQLITLTVDSYPDITFKGKISIIDTQINTDTRSLSIRALVDNHDDQHPLLPGMLVAIHTQMPEQQAVVTLPETAILFTLYGNSVYIATPSSKQPGQYIAKQANVQVGNARNGTLPVYKGVKAGDRVVTAGQLKLSDGRAISIQKQPEQKR